jgi:hypothetical protein
MRIDHVYKQATLLGISDGARVRGKYDITVDGQSFYSIFVFQTYSSSELSAIYCSFSIPSKFPEAVNAALIAGNNEIVLVGVETKERTTMQVNSITTYLRIVGRGPKTYRPGKRICSLMIDKQRIAHLPIYFPDSSSKTPEATVENIGEENELLLIEALTAGRECLVC